MTTNSTDNNPTIYAVQLTVSLVPEGTKGIPPTTPDGKYQYSYNPATVTVKKKSSDPTKQEVVVSLVSTSTISITAFSSNDTKSQLTAVIAADGRSVTISDADTVGETIYYQITITDTATGLKETLDPQIINVIE